MQGQTRSGGEDQPGPSDCRPTRCPGQKFRAGQLMCCVPPAAATQTPPLPACHSRQLTGQELNALFRSPAHRTSTHRTSRCMAESAAPLRQRVGWAAGWGAGPTCACRHARCGGCPRAQACSRAAQAAAGMRSAGAGVPERRRGWCGGRAGPGLAGSPGAVHSGVPAWLLVLSMVLRRARDNPKSQT